MRHPFTTKPALLALAVSLTVCTARAQHHDAALPSPPPPAAGLPPITMTMDNIPIGDVLRYMSMGMGLQMRVEKNAVLLCTRDATPATDMRTRIYLVSDALLGALPQQAVDEAGVDPVFLCEYLETLGIPFPEGAQAQLLPELKRLVLTNHPVHLRKAETVLGELLAASADAHYRETGRVTGNLPTLEEIGRAGDLKRKLNSSIIPHIEFQDASLHDVIDVLMRRSRELDPQKVGINIFTLLPYVPPPHRLRQYDDDFLLDDDDDWNDDDDHDDWDDHDDHDDHDH